MHDRDVVLSALETGFVHADEFDTGKGFAGSGLTDVVIDAPPKLLVRAAKHSSGLAHRQLLAKRKGQRLERCGEARARACLRHRHLRGLAAAAASNPRHIAVQPGLELEQIEVTPGSGESIMHSLISGSTSWTSEASTGTANLEVDPASGGVKLDALYDPTGALTPEHW